MKRSSKEGRWAGGLQPPRARFAAEAVFLILVAAGAALAQLSPLAIIGLMLLAWLLVALIERASSREQARPLAGGAEELDDEDLREAQPVHEVEVRAEAPAAEPSRQVAYRWLFWRRERATIELEAPTAALEERPSRAHVRKIEAEAPPPAIEVETIVAEIVDTGEPQPGPSVTKRPLELPGLEEPVPARVAATPPVPKEPFVEAPFAEAPLPPVEAPPVAPVAEAPPEPALPEQASPPPPEPPRVPAAPLGPPREWNIWDLESRAREQAGDPVRDEEWSALFMFLREHANADGVLPIQFDDLVRESFSELIQAA